jgi:ribosome-binding protein aMBF1 (putative translation factor)
MTTGEMIRSARERLRMSRAELAKRVRRDYTTIVKVEKNQRLPSALLASRMEEALSLKPGDLLNHVLQQKERTNQEREKKREIVYKSTLTASEIEKVLRRHEEAKSKRIKSKPAQPR